MSIARTCNLCGIIMTGGIEGFIEHGKKQHPDYFLNGKNIKDRFRFAKKVYFCPPLDRWFSCIQHIARAIHKQGMTSESYYNKFGKDYMPNEWQKNNFDKKYGNASSTPTCLECAAPVKFQDSKWQYPKFCSFSCSTRWHAHNTDRVEVAQKTLKARQVDNPDLALKPNHHRYWTLRGLSDEEASAKVKERQQTNTLERFIKRYGETAGLQKWLDRQERWFISMKASGVFGGYSRVAIQLFEHVEKTVHEIKYGQDEIQIRCGSRVVWVDCLYEKKVIEFFGDYWHANPNKYSRSHMIKSRTAEQVWAHDDARIKIMEDAGYQVMIIWESEYAENPERTIGKCIGFLKPLKYIHDQISS